jgi:hypothetical protein
MSLPAWIGIPGAVLLLAFIAYGFRQGMRVTPSEGAGLTIKTTIRPAEQHT